MCTCVRPQIECTYHLKPVGLPVPFRAVATLTLDANDPTRIAQHVDEWMGVPLRREEDGWLGRLAAARRRLTGAMQEAFVRATGGDKISYD
jgi:hypothetical protein